MRPYTAPAPREVAAQHGFRARKQSGVRMFGTQPRSFRGGPHTAYFFPMYSKTEVSQLRQAFWTTFGHYMAPVPSSEGVPTSWINYKTGLKNVYFRLRADGRRASIGIELTHPDAGLRELFFEQFRQLRPLLEEATGEAWTWQADAPDDSGQPRSRIYQALHPVNLFNRDDWPRLISFFKPRLVALDEFWSTAQYAFDMLR